MQNIKPRNPVRCLEKKLPGGKHGERTESKEGRRGNGKKMERKIESAKRGKHQMLTRQAINDDVRHQKSMIHRGNKSLKAL